MLLAPLISAATPSVLWWPSCYSEQLGSRSTVDIRLWPLFAQLRHNTERRNGDTLLTFPLWSTRWSDGSKNNLGDRSDTPTRHGWVDDELTSHQQVTWRETVLDPTWMPTIRILPKTVSCEGFTAHFSRLLHWLASKLTYYNCNLSKQLILTRTPHFCLQRFI